MFDKAEKFEDGKELDKLLDERYKKELRVKKLKEEIKKSDVYWSIWKLGEEDRYL